MSSGLDPAGFPIHRKRAIARSCQPGSGGSALGRAVATRLGAAYLDQEILHAAARRPLAARLETFALFTLLFAIMLLLAASAR